MPVATGTSPTTTRWLLFLAAAALAALGGALLLQHVGGFKPCPLCIYQRYPYVVVAAAGLLGAWLGRPRLALVVIGVALAVDVGLGVYHVGIEQGWFALPEGCAAVGTATTVEELKAQLLAAPARCDQVPFTVLGLSLAGWSAVYAAVLLAVTLVALLAPARSAAEQDRNVRTA